MRNDNQVALMRHGVLLRLTFPAVDVETTGSGAKSAVTLEHSDLMALGRFTVKSKTH